MRSIRFLVLAALALVTVGLMLTACFNYQNDCRYTLECAENPGTGGDGGPAPGCDPTQTKDPVADNCGIFVSPAGDDKNTGSKLLPLKTLTAAVAKGGAIYACAGTTPYTEAVTVSKPVTIFGGVDCTTWAASPGHKSQLTAAAGMVPLSLEAKATGSVIHDFAVTSADATAAGASSIAIVDDSASVTLDGVDVSAGKGAPGTAGAAPPMQVMTPATASGGNGNPDASCNAASTVGGIPGTNSCDGVATNGGAGGGGFAVTPGTPGTGGAPLMTPSNGGAGQTATMPCGTGLAGTMGALGQSGAGAHGIGDVSSSGYQGPVAMMGAAPGGPGQGGGGGGSAKQCNGTSAGPSGGGGGAGGCGGAVGAPATSGGSSIGILTLNATLKMTGVTITTHVGGDGGAGGDGQTGGSGGIGGQPGSIGACAGGQGGQGGIGGGGGGGAGGHSLGIAVKGGMVPDLKGATVSHGMGGGGGNGGNMDAGITARGSDGLACKTFDFGNPMSPTACAM